ncbi:MAG: 2-oxoglutarate oxidoreductase [Lachnospiraceae bacterium]|nr:2-oxoglutarate oxidoreductase [Lachnospiraceae bacterium]
MEKIYSRTKAVNQVSGGFCPGCFHGVIVKIIGEVTEEMGLIDKAVCVIGVGCCNNIYGYVKGKVDMVNTPHGRAPAVATGLKRMAPQDTLVYTYQGDGDCAAIGLSEIIYAANRGEKITVIFVNNSTYGMTGGQMAPTTLIGQKSTTTPKGRDADDVGYPMHMCELLNTLRAPVFITRVSCDTAPHILKAKEAIRKGFQNQIDGKGFSFIEIMSSCPTNWGLSPVDSVKFMQENTLKEFPIGTLRDN